MAHYRERSREVMALVGELGVPTQPVSLDEVYLDLSSVPDPVARMSGLVRAIREQLQPRRVGRDGPEPAGRQGRLGRREAARLRRPHPRAGREALRAGAAAADPRHRPEDRRAPRGARGEDDRRPAGASRRGADAPLRPEPRPRAARARALPRRLAGRAAARRSRARSRPPSTTTSPTSRELEQVLDEQSDAPRRPSCASATLRGRTIGIKVRLDDWTTVTRVHTIDGADQRPRADRLDRAARCCAPTRPRGRCACSASRWRPSPTPARSRPSRGP